MGGIYISSKAKHGARWRELRAAGLPVVSTWIDESEVGQTADYQDLWSRNVREAASARAVVAYGEPGEVMKGALVEIGAALACGVPVFWAGPVDGYTVVEHPLVRDCKSLDMAIALALARVGSATDAAPTQTPYTRAQLAAAVDEAHAALHEAIDRAGEARIGHDAVNALSRAHEALHRVGAGQPRIGCATQDPEAQAVLPDVIESGKREPFGGRYYGIWNVESCDGEPLALFQWLDEAEAELARRRALPEDDDLRLTEWHQVFPCDLVGAWWNSYEPDPRENSPLTIDEIVAVQDGDL